MTQSELTTQYKQWAGGIGLKKPPVLEKKRITLYIRDLFESDDLLIGQIHYAVPVYTDKLHVFKYSMRTVWMKNSKGDTADILDETYTV